MIKRIFIKKYENLDNIALLVLSWTGTIATIGFLYKDFY